MRRDTGQVVKEIHDTQVVKIQLEHSAYLSTLYKFRGPTYILRGYLYELMSAIRKMHYYKLGPSFDNQQSWR
jgi:hypothetical protein